MPTQPIFIDGPCVLALKSGLRGVNFLRGTAHAQFHADDLGEIAA